MELPRKNFCNNEKFLLLQAFAHFLERNTGLETNFEQPRKFILQELAYVVATV